METIISAPSRPAFFSLIDKIEIGAGNTGGFGSWLSGFVSSGSLSFGFVSSGSWLSGLVSSGSEGFSSVSSALV